MLLLVCGAWALFSWALLAQHRAYNSNGWDLSWFDQVIWNTAHGRPFATSFVGWNFLGEHVEPVLVLFAGVYRIHPDVELLLLTQAAVAAWAAVPLYLAARRVLLSATAGLLIAAAYLASAYLHNAMVFDFHPEVLGTASIFAAFALLVAGRPGWALAAIGSQFLLKEDAALVAIGFAWLMWLYGYRRQTIALAAASVVYFVLVAGVLMPAVRGGPGGPHARYEYLGKSTPEAVVGTLRHPDRVWVHLTGPDQRHTVAMVFGSLALMPLATPALLAAAPLTVAHLLSEHPSQSRLALHYGVLPFALLLVAATLGIRALADSSRLTPVWRRLPVPSAHRAVALATVLLALTCARSAVAGPFGLRFDMSHYRRTPHDAAVARVLAVVPRGGSVSAQSGLLPHLSQRRAVWEFPPLKGAMYVVVDRTAWWQVHGPPSPELDYDAVLASLAERGYCLVTEEDGVELYARPDLCAGR